MNHTDAGAEQGFDGGFERDRRVRGGVQNGVEGSFGEQLQNSDK